MEKIVEESNRYANQVMGDEKFNKWTKVTVEELEAFLGFHILMDIIHLPAVDDYGRGDPLLRYAPIADRESPASDRSPIEEVRKAVSTTP